MSWPVLRNDREAGKAIGVTDVLLAAAIAWGVPIALGGALLAIDVILLREGGAATALTGVAVALLYSPILSWTGLVPAALILLGLIRLGWGGVVPAVAVGAALGLAMALALFAGAPGALWLMTAAGAVLSGICWGAVKWRRPAALVA